MSDRLSDEDRAELVAYLDGETSGDARRAIESKLSLDPAWRAEAESLRRTWDLLDFLPRPEPSPSFTQRTMSKLEPVRQAAPQPTKKPARLRRAAVWATLAGAWAAGLLAAAWCGYAGYQALVPHRPGEAELTRELRIIENKRFYDNVESLEFLKELDQPDLFGEEGIGG